MKILALIAIMALIPSAGAASWSSTVSTDTNSWSIYRQSGNLSFDYYQSVQGMISPVDFRGRALNPYFSAYKEVDMNYVRLRDRTSAFQGRYSSDETVMLRSSTANPVCLNITKLAGSPIYTIQYSEQWPVVLKSSRTVEYSGREINDREFAGNNLDFAGSSLLYNKELSKETKVGLLLTKMNATVLATDEAILSADFMASREMDYSIRTHTTGIADLKYRQTGTRYNFKRSSYNTLNEGEERYYGIYDISRHIRMKSDFLNTSSIDDWMPCCSGGWDSMNYHDKKGLGASTRGVFDCTCYKVLSKG